MGPDEDDELGILDPDQDEDQTFLHQDQDKDGFPGNGSGSGNVSGIR